MALICEGGGDAGGGNVRDVPPWRMLWEGERGPPWRTLSAVAQAAYLVIEQSMTMSLAVVVPLLASGVVPDIAPDRIALRFETRRVLHHGRTIDELKSALRLLSPSYATCDARWAARPEAVRLPDHAALIDHARIRFETCFRPLIRRLHARTGLPSGAMWRLVGDSVSAVFLDAGRRLGCEDEAKRDALAILKRPGSPLANRQMHYFDIVIRDPADSDRILASRSFRSRGGCCRYYTSREGKLCTTCVLLAPAARDRNLEAKLRFRLGLAPASTPTPRHTA